MSAVFFTLPSENGESSPTDSSLSVKLRYAARPTAATVKFFGDRAEVLLAEPVRAVTPGQSAVFYDGDLLLAGGFIDTAKS